ncbi:MAG: hypothetical protein Hals2KO_33140 [Halioglobus sp.]
MTAKDLHFSFDSTLAQEAPAAAQTPPGLSSVAALPGTGKPARRAQTAKPNRQWLAVTGIALLNMAFLLLAALWLSGNAYQVSDRQPPGITTTNGTDSALADLHAASDRNEQQLSAVQAALQEQARLLVALQAELAQLNAAGAIAPPAASATAVTVAATPDWHINLGAFRTADAARTVLRDVRDKGYSPDVQQEVIGGETTYRVVLKGFASREAADAEAHRIMQQTSLSGLWVWDGQ